MSAKAANRVECKPSVMKLFQLLGFLLANSFISGIYADEHVPTDWLASHTQALMPVCHAQQVLDAQAGELLPPKTLENILKIEANWLGIEASKRGAFRFLSEPTNQVLLNTLHHSDAVVEIIVTDYMGATLFAEPTPSDYWQGDEDKFRVPAATGRVHTSKLSLDDSSGEYAVQVSVPNYNEGSFLGVCVFTLRVPLNILLQLDAR